MQQYLPSTPHEGRQTGERTPVPTHLICAPNAGVFVPAASVAVGDKVLPGDVLGVIAGSPVTAWEPGIVGRMIAVAGQRLMRHEPVFEVLHAA